MFESIEIIEEKMNRAGKEKKPFLFGFKYDLSEGFFISNPLNQKEILFDVNGTGNSRQGLASNSTEISFVPHPESYEKYKNKFDKTLQRMKNGETELINLTIKTPISSSLNLREIFHLNHAKYRLLIPGRFTCFSPECFVRICNNKISSFPMKGTIDATIPDAEHLIINNTKEIDEHSASVELIKEDLSKVASDVRIKRFRYIDRLVNYNSVLLQVSSEVEGDLKDKFRENLGSVLISLLPAGSIAGIPKKKSIEIIAEIEEHPRDYYTGIFGYFDGENLDSGVMIRFIEEENGNLFFRSGGGITTGSDCYKEYCEAIQKIYLPVNRK